jgi:hypothetical protein
MTGATQQTTFLEELYRYRDVLHRYNFRYHLACYPKDLLAMWWRKEGCLPWPTSRVAFESFSAGKKPGHLYRGPPHWPKLKVITGGKA